jgi:hypothetical protein
MAEEYSAPHPSARMEVTYQDILELDRAVELLEDMAR